MVTENVRIVAVQASNLHDAARIHSRSWQDAHRAFCNPEFVALHTPERQEKYLRQKTADGSALYILLGPEPIGIVSVKNSCIEDLYVLPEQQNKGYGSMLLQFAIKTCPNTPTLWILENNTRARKLYERFGFRETGGRKQVTHGLDEIEFALLKCE